MQDTFKKKMFFIKKNLKRANLIKLQHETSYLIASP